MPPRPPFPSITKVLLYRSFSRAFLMSDGLVSSLNQVGQTLRRSGRLLSAAASTSVQVQETHSGDGPLVSRISKRKSVETRGVVIEGEAVTVNTTVFDEAATLELPSPKKKKKSKKKEAFLPDEDEFVGGAAKPKRKKPEPVYVIPDIEKKETTFKGRLGYACLNTVLRNKKPAMESVFCSRTCRLDSLKKNGVEWLKDLGRKNVEDLKTIIQWNEDNNIRFFRLSSEMFPFASHADHGYSLDYCANLLAEAGALARKYGHRLTVHPGQYTQLGSPKPGVVEAACRDLAYHCEMLDLMGMGPDSVMIIHGGGVYDDKVTTLERLKQSIRDLPTNMCYNAEELLEVCEELDVPLVFDYHHDAIYPSSISPQEIIKRANAIFDRRGIKPKQHLSEPRPGAVTIMERRAHADRCENLPDDLPGDMDLMIEAKDKEQAVFHLYRMYGLQPVMHANLRPPAAKQSTQTNGRKSNKRARAKAEKEGNKEQDKDEESALSRCLEEEEE
ncbi:hypothetical protein NLJ89_g7321 [Agrocybe chaxingu]|uniref:UV-endonuclease UvdE n=1 Tax=Agrocybe chaxingu TaxID=84603 RepID=A0A9W8JZC3_9AGAR|nr:hypothetical protein NLJ89_g7321 [Agrocybe chaxingu]